MQNAGMAALGLNWRYLAFDVAPDDLRAAIHGAMRMGFVGINLTIPHKVAAMECVDAVDARARDWGAINTLVFEGRNGGEWQPAWAFNEPPQEARVRGFNTDADAIARVIERDLGCPIRGSRVLLLGAGGAGRVAALKLAEHQPASLFLVNRTMEKAEAVRKEIHARFPNVRATLGYPNGEVDLTVNGTSLGLAPDDPLPCDAQSFPLDRTRCVFDMVYQPGETRFVGEARAAGCAATDGLGMLLYQGAASLELWSGKTAPLETMRAALWKQAGRKLEERK